MESADGRQKPGRSAAASSARSEAAQRKPSGQVRQVGASEAMVADADEEDDEDEEEDEVLGTTSASEPAGHAQRLRSAVGIVRPAHAKHCASSAGIVTDEPALTLTLPLPLALTLILVLLPLAFARGSTLVLTSMLMEFAPHGAQK